MKAIPPIEKALNDMSQDVRPLGEAAKTDFKQLSHAAEELAQNQIRRPSAQMAKETAQQLEVHARSSPEATKE